MDDQGRTALLRDAAGDDAVTPPDIDAIVRRARRRTVRRTSAAIALILCLAVAAGAVVTDLRGPQVLRFATPGGPDAVPRSPDGGRGLAEVDGLPARAEGVTAALDDGFVAVSTAAPPTVWTTDDGRTWTQQPARGFGGDPISDVTVSPSGQLAALDSAYALWVSDDRGASWREVGLPAVVRRAQPTEVAADAGHWYLAGEDPDSDDALVFALTQDPDPDLIELGGDAPAYIIPAWRPGLRPRLAARRDGVVVLMAGGSQPAFHEIIPGRPGHQQRGTGTTATWFTDIAATADGYLATVRTTDDGDGPVEVWTSTDGRAWSPTGVAVPAAIPSCARIVQSGDMLLATGSPCDADAGWRSWVRVDGQWLHMSGEMD